jgi:hypothetical protein
MVKLLLVKWALRAAHTNEGSNEHTDLIRKSQRYELDVIVSEQTPVTCKYETL